MPADTDFYRALIEDLGDGVYFVDEFRCITYWNKGAERITGFPAEEVMGKRCSDGVLNHVDETGRRLCGRRCPLLRTMHDGQIREEPVFLHHARGYRLPVLVKASPMRLGDGRIVGAVETFSENTSLVDAMRRIHELGNEACRDPLTQVGNRRFADGKLDSALREFHGHGMQHGVLFIDIDHFKVVNDRYGHRSGDRILTAVGRTMTSNLRTTDVVARWGGEEFLAIVYNVDDERLHALAENVRMLVASSRTIVGDQIIRVTVSVGATLMRRDDSVESLMDRVDTLMYRSKSCGRDRVTVDGGPTARARVS
jgi:diguanylate cyclase (GGDEF)-like protein/PAS domain S-box-containing protein